MIYTKNEIGERTWRVRLSACIITGSLIAGAAFSPGVIFAEAGDEGADGSLESAGQASEVIEVSMELPKADYWVTDFSTAGSYTVTVNGENKIFKGVPYTYLSYTYVPLRDLSEAYGITVAYEERDRSVMLSVPGKAILLSAGTLGKSGGFIHGGANVVEDEDAMSTPISINNGVSYVPLRFITENFGFTVTYDETSKGITITGPQYEQTDKGYREWYSADQALIIEAARNMEQSTKFKVNGQVSYLDEMRTVEAEVERDYGSPGALLAEKMTVQEAGGDSYIAVRERDSKSTSLSVQVKSENGVYESINLKGWGMEHPYVNVGDTSLYGIWKYDNMSIETLEETGEYVVYKIDLVLNNAGSAVLEVTIDKEKKMITKYKEDGVYSQKDVTYTYEK